MTLILFFFKDLVLIDLGIGVQNYTFYTLARLPFGNFKSKKKSAMAADF